MLAGWLDRQPAPAAWVVLCTALAALVAVAWPRSWRVLRHVVTIVHEGGHATLALVTGRRLRGIRLHSDTSGVTVSSGRPTGPGMVLTALAGYVFPALVGLAAAAAVSSGRLTATLWAATGLLALLLLQVRNVFGVLSVVLTGAVLVLVSRFADASWQGAAAYLLTWFLLVGAPVPVVELQRARSAGGAPTSDADQLARLTRLPGLVWVGVFLLVTLGAAVAGAGLLLREVLRA